MYPLHRLRNKNELPENNSGWLFPDSTGFNVPLRSQPATIKPIKNRSGSVSYRVTASIKGKQRKRLFLCLEDAQSTQALWELERVQAAAALRPKITRLTQAELATAEAANEILRNSGLSLVEAANIALLNRPQKGAGILFLQGLSDFLAERTGFISSSQHENYRLVGQKFGKFIGPATTVGKVTAEKITHWLRLLAEDSQEFVENCCAQRSKTA